MRYNDKNHYVDGFWRDTKFVVEVAETRLNSALELIKIGIGNYRDEIERLERENEKLEGTVNYLEYEIKELREKIKELRNSLENNGVNKINE